MTFLIFQRTKNSSLHHRTNPQDKIRVYGLCDSTMFAVRIIVHKLIIGKKQCTWSAFIPALCPPPPPPPPRNMFMSKRGFSSRSGTVFTELCVFSAIKIHPWKLQENERLMGS